MLVAIEHFIAQGHAVRGHHQTDTHLQTVRPTVARVTPLGHRVRLALPFKVGAGHVVEKQFIVEVKQISQPLFEMFFDRLLVRQQLIQRGIQTPMMNLVRRHAQQIIQRRTTVPRVGYIRTPDMGWSKCDRLVGLDGEPKAEVSARKDGVQLVQFLAEIGEGPRPMG